MNPGCLAPGSSNKKLVSGLCSSFPTGPLPRRALYLEFNSCSCHLEIHFISEFVLLSEAQWDSRAWLGAHGAVTHMWSPPPPYFPRTGFCPALWPLCIPKLAKLHTGKVFIITPILKYFWQHGEACPVPISFQDLCCTPKSPEAKAQVQW